MFVHEAVLNKGISVLTVALRVIAKYLLSMGRSFLEYASTLNVSRDWDAGLEVLSCVESKS